MKAAALTLCLLLLAPLAQAAGEPPLPFPGLPPAACAWLANVLACMDRDGSHYSVATLGHDTYLRGFDAASGQRWAQTGTRYGRLTFFSGVSSDGQVWVGSSRGIGWTHVSRLSSSSGGQAKLTCGRVSGCSQRVR
ncbi:hypothetical protein DK254_14895 [Pseudomonas sp. RW407]|uniref:hypothetical protein n=1 Tax=Pseudomonas sp. RW407 TaxID=2202894 RepID=UPI000D7031E5|nr:hypothetical protein [Pseudomonas sp. RW407]PWU29423.1 hypothetical protein DK254_14895 [Pseudomonas sp. RW407]